MTPVPGVLESKSRGGLEEARKGNLRQPQNPWKQIWTSDGLWVQKGLHPPLAEPSVGKPSIGAANLQDCHLVDQPCLRWNLQKFYTISKADYVSSNNSQSWCQNQLCPVRESATPLSCLLDREVWRGYSGRLSRLLLAQLIWSCWERDRD